MKKKIIYLSVLLVFCLISRTGAQNLQWSLSDGFDFINNSEMRSHVQKSNSTYTIQTVPMIQNNHWFELWNFKLLKETLLFNQGLPLNKKIGTKDDPEYFYFPASYQVGIYFVHKDQACQVSSPQKESTPLVSKISDEGFFGGGESKYFNMTSFAYDAALVIDNSTCMNFEKTRWGYQPDLDNLINTTTLIGFNNGKEAEAFKHETIDFDPEKGIRLERSGNAIHYKYAGQTIFSTEIEKVNDYRIVVAIYSPLSENSKNLMNPISLERNSCITVDQLFGLNKESLSLEYQWLALSSDERYELYMEEYWKDFYHSFGYKYSNGYEVSEDSYCKCEDIGDKNENYNTACNYDIKGNLRRQSIGYYDDLGKGTQNQTLDMKIGKLWLNQTLYDQKGRAAFQSLSAPTMGNLRFLKDNNFIKDRFNNNYDSQDFETGDILSPNTVAPTPNTLGWYYSNQNTDEPLLDITDRPYARSIYSDLFPGQVKQIIGGNKQNGQWRQGYIFSMPAGQELSQSIAFGESKYNSIKTIKTVSRDIHGAENVVFTDTDGKALASARSGEGSLRNMFVTVGEQGFVDIHIPENITGFSITKPSSIQVEVYDLITEELVTGTTSALSNGFYRVSITNLDNFNPDIMTVRVNYKENYYDYALNEYNELGQLIASYQPLGTSKATKPKTSFAYDGLGRLTSTTSPEEGTVNFKYREDGQIRFSQNSKQLLSNEFSYTNYDSKGRPIETGVANGNFNTLNPDNITFAFSSKKEQIFTQYDYLTNLSELASLHPDYRNPTFLAGNIAKTYNKDVNGNTIAATYYSYDLYGRVKWTAQNINGLGFKTIEYEYDPVTSQILKVIYQKYNTNELFVHRYTYNPSNQELEKVETSTDNQNFITHADYTYYETGAVKRVELANGIQGIDYVYNLAGQLKAINHPNLNAASDPGGDSNDLFGMTIDYHNNDYSRNTNFNLITSGQDRFNGNIKGVTSNTKWTNTLQPNAKYIYEYNKNNWLERADFSGGNAIWSSDYRVQIPEYDANGNIKRLIRNKNLQGGNNQMDDFTYVYKDNNSSNKLDHIDDAVTSPTGVNDLKDQNSNNYTYNEIGQLIENAEESVKYEYNAIGLVTKVIQNGVLKVAFTYDDKGFRVKKTSYFPSMPPVNTYYVRDASGNPIAIYDNSTQKDLPVYGFNRLGVFNRVNNTSVYELTDHLGNVRAVIQKDGFGNTAALVSATDYYPFGMPMPNRQIVGDYRYAYQGQEKDSETGKEAFQLRLWDSRIGRWLSPDPYGQYYSPYLGMGNNPISMIDPDGGFACYARVNGKVQQVPCRKGDEKHENVTVQIGRKFVNAPSILYGDLYYDDDYLSQIVITSKKTHDFVNHKNEHYYEHKAMQDGVRAAQAEAAGIITMIAAEVVMTVIPELRLLRGSRLLNVGKAGFQRYSWNVTAPKMYRAMSNAEYAAFLKNGGGLTVKGKKELFVSTERAYSAKYLKKDGYDVLLELRIKPGGVDHFYKHGVYHGRMATARKGWDLRGHYLWKYEQGAWNLGIGRNAERFNSYIQSFKKLN